MDASGVVVEHRGEALWLTLDAPDTANALTADMVTVLLEQLRGVASREDVRVVVLTGRGDAFSSGADLSGAHPEQRYDGRAVDAAGMLVTAITEADQPVVCGLNGVAAGVGASVVLACDLVVARASAGLTLGFTRIGLMPDGGATATLAAAVGRARAMRMALLSEVISAEEAHRAGMISHVVADGDFASELDRVVARVVAGPPLAHAATKKAVNAATLAGLPGAFQRERAGQSVLLRTADVTEGMAAFAEKRRPRFGGR